MKEAADAGNEQAQAILGRVYEVRAERESVLARSPDGRSCSWGTRT